MERINIVVGANFGDEGKGLVTNYLTVNRTTPYAANVLYNGGCQRGHTANNHVFHCFGSGTLRGAETWYDAAFIANPIGWDVERHQLGIKGTINAYPICPVATPYDVAINQAIEQKRGNNRHGSCGMGIYETVLRERAGYSLLISDLADQNRTYRILKEIYNEYLGTRLEQLGISAIPTVSIEQFMVSAFEMSKHLNIKTDFNLKDLTKSWVFEGGQGLLLSEKNLDYFPHLTPSDTGSTIARNTLHYEGIGPKEICVNYVTRPYMTRHGAGKFETEDPDLFFPDRTNQPNPYQGTLRFGYLDLPLFLQSIYDDMYFGFNPPTKVRLCITQLNLTNGEILIGKNKTISPEELRKKVEEKLGFEIELLTLDSELI